MDQDQAPMQIAPFPPSRGPRPANMVGSAAFMLVGAFAATVMPVLGVALMGYGARGMYEAGGTKGFALAALVGAAAVAGMVAFEPLLATGTLSGVLAALGAVWCMRRRAATTLGVSLVIVACAGVSLGVDAFLLTQAGASSVSAEYTALIMETARVTLGQGIEADMVLRQAEPVFQAIWPVLYVVSATMNVLSAAIGSHLMAARAYGDSRMPSIARYDAPLWAVGVLAVSVAGLGVSFSPVPYAEVLRTVCATALLSVRMIFTLQGFGVVLCRLNARRAGCFFRVVLLTLLIQLEATLFVVSVVGLIDVWANFRKLPRTGSHARAQQ